jgi:chromatin segregation and condensation protein Rec8/ScpA/Scc1 (kleisin family)
VEQTHCGISDCNSPYEARGFCKAHYKQDYARRNQQKLKDDRIARKAKTDPEKTKEYFRQHYQRNKDRVKANTKKYKEARPEWNRAYKRAYREKNLDRLREKNREHYKANSHVYKVRAVERMKKVARAIPAWVSDIERAQIRQFYANCPPGYHVDHIIPLQGKNVSGLHVLSNLQYLPAVENLRKGNRYEAS